MQSRNNCSHENPRFELSTVRKTPRTRTQNSSKLESYNTANNRSLVERQLQWKQNDIRSSGGEKKSAIIEKFIVEMQGVRKGGEGQSRKVRREAWYELCHIDSYSYNNGEGRQLPRHRLDSGEHNGQWLPV